jgi:NAD(P)-dependent dehydrogenase (short-subunit alcohol dehydrogenase family)
MLNRNWLITGVASGFGRIMTAKLLAQGARVAGTVQNKEAIVDLRQAFGNRLWLACLDLAKTDAICDIVDEAFWELGTIDVVVDLLGSCHLQRAIHLHLQRQGCGCMLHFADISQDGSGELNPARRHAAAPDDALMPPVLAYGLSEWTSAI